MTTSNQITTNFIDSDGSDVGNKYVTKSYLMDVYPYLNVGNLEFPALWTWGTCSYGQLGDNTITNKSSPVQTISGGTTWKQISCGYQYISSIKTDGTLWTWGRNNNYAQLGDSTLTNRSSPVQTISGGTTWKGVSCGLGQTAAIKTDGTLWMWGYNQTGQLGDSTTTNRSAPQQTISRGTNWKLAACGGNHTAAIKTDGTLWMWGSNGSGQLGDSTTTNKSSPVQTISGGTTWKQVSCGTTFTSALKTDGTLWTWGQNNSGQLGDSNLTARSSPTQTISGGTAWKQVSCGGNHTAAIKTDGTLWMWGLNTSGQLGDSTTVTARSVPQQTISGGSNWKLAACGNISTATIKTDGTLWGWGNALTLGDGTITGKSSPVQTIARGTTWKQVSVGYQHAGAIQENGDDF